MQPVGSRVWDALRTFAPIDLFDSGLSDALGLETYEHGTSPASYDAIYSHGIDPEFGGTGGETGFFQATIKNELAFAELRTLDRFFAFNHHPRLGPILPSLVGYVVKSVLARNYAVLSSIAGQTHETHNLFYYLKGFFLGLITPIIKIRFLPEEAGKIFENDEFFEQGFASYTEEKISVEHLGIGGTLRKGFNKEWASRFKKNPAVCLWGVVKMITALALVVLTVLASVYSGAALSFFLSYAGLKALQAIARFVIPYLSRVAQVRVPRDKEAEAKLVDEFTQNVKPSIGQPVAIIFSGCNGSGKTTQRRRLLDGEERQYVILDYDEIMQKMPQYQTLLEKGGQEAASALHTASLRMRAKVFKKAVNEKKSLVIEGTGSNLTLYKEMIRKLREQNYHIKLVRCEVDLKEAKNRVRKREELMSLRHVPSQAIEFAHSQSKRNLPALRALVDDYELIDSST